MKTGPPRAALLARPVSWLNSRLDSLVIVIATTLPLVGMLLHDRCGANKGDGADGSGVNGGGHGHEHPRTTAHPGRIPGDDLHSALSHPPSPADRASQLATATPRPITEDHAGHRGDPRGDVFVLPTQT